MTQDWDIKSRGIACAACAAAFGDGQSYYSALSIGETGFERGDFCEACWEASDRSAPYSSWQGIYRLPPAGPEEPLRKETAESLLRKLIEERLPENDGVIYILAVMLERKKILIEKDVTVDEIGTVHRVYEHRHSGETFLILDPRLELDQIEDVQKRVIGMLGGPLPRSDNNNPPNQTDQTDTDDSPDTPAPHDEPEDR